MVPIPGIINFWKILIMHASYYDCYRDPYCVLLGSRLIGLLLECARTMGNVIN